jgi:RNA polymerase sigma factor (sigma-70 family)
LTHGEIEQLYLEHRRALERFVFFKTPSREDAEDILQDVLLKVLEKSDTLQNANHFKPWLFQIAANRIRDFYRRRARQPDISLDERKDEIVSLSRYGRTVGENVYDTLDALRDNDREILEMVYLQNKPQSEIAQLLNIPVGTVKSRLYTAKQHFRAEYGEEKPKGVLMSQLPEICPDYKIKRSGLSPFDVRWEELMGWFIVPKLGENISWAMYEFPERRQSERYDIKVVGRASVHGVEGVEITVTDTNGGTHESKPDQRNITRSFVAQLTDTHSRFLAESHTAHGVKKIFTFLDGDEFLENWGFGEDNCGNNIFPKQNGHIIRNGSEITCDRENGLLDVVGRYTITIGGKAYDTICVMDAECYNGTLSEQYIDEKGRTILWRRFNRNDWRISHYKKLWSEILPKNEKLSLNGKSYVHWYDCITNYIL